MSSNFYLTTPLYYVNGEPHIGHAYTTILADVLTRYHRLFGEREVHFLTGLDEHGQKVSQAAAENSKTPQEHCDEMAVLWKDVWEKLSIAYDDFIRTTEPRHEKVVMDFLNRIYEKDDVYVKKYEGWYSVYEERYFTEKDLVDGKDPISGRPVEKREETNYFFRMSKYQEWLIDYYEKNPDSVIPKFRLNEVKGFLRQPLGDLCISRPKSRLEWGIPIPWDDDYVTYVWFDALINYYSATLKPPKGKTVTWPADLHLIAKDILTTHAVYWPIMLHAAGYEPPKQIFAHGWWLDKDAAKMSKSEGNVIRPLDLADKFGADTFRYYVMREMTAGQDANFSIDGFVKRINSDLANDLGNLYSRLAKLYHQFSWGKYKQSGSKQDNFEGKLTEQLNAVRDKVKNEIEAIRPHKAIEEIMALVRELNRYIEHWEPWKSAKIKPEATGYAMLEAIDCLDWVAELLAPIMPERMKLLRQWIKNDVHIPLKGLHLFPRIDLSELQIDEQNGNDAVNHGGSTVSDEISIEDFKHLDIRVGLVIEAKKIKGADRLLSLKVDIGNEVRQIVAGIAKSYNPEDLKGKRVIVLVNLKPVKLRGALSQGMVLAAVSGKDIVLLTTDGNVEIGVEVS
ncbi:MAG: methionine--tRNA ligase [Candidatus Hatepunaea meridiana]|nr:methionine--tRNA ligase [Candidatus Hatepunaea meridiana]